MVNNQEIGSILIVEDEVLIATDLERRLIKLGYTVCGKTTTGESALELVEENQPDLVILDVVLKGKLDGIAVANIIRSKCRTPVVFLTAHADVDRLQQARFTHPFGLLVKPFQERDLQRTVELALYKAKVDKENGKAEEELKKYKQIVSSTRDGIALLDRDYRYQIVNDAYESYSGSKKEDLVGRTISDYLGRETFEREIKDRFDQCLKGETVIFQMKLEYRNKGRRFVEITYYPYIDPDGNIDGVVANTRDITEQKLAEDALRESENNYRSLFINAPLFISVYDKKGICLMMNKAVSNNFNGEPVDFIGKSFYDLHPEKAEEYIGRIIDVIDSGQVQHHEDMVRFPQGISWLLSTVHPVQNYMGEIYAAQILSVDITARKRAEEALEKSEERFRLAMKFANYGLFDWNLVTNEIYYSPGWKMLLGYENHEIQNEISVWKRLTAPEDVKKSWKMLNEVLEGKRDRFENEFKMKHKDGNWVDILSRANIVHDDNGKPIRVVGTHVDVTIRKKTEKELMESEERYRSLFASINDGVCLHEIVYDGEKPVDYRILDVNPSYETTTGIKSNTAVGTLASKLYGSDRPPYLEIYAQVAATGNPASFESYFEPMDKHFLISVFSPGPGKFATVFQDITDRKKSEEALRESEERFRGIVENSDAGYFFIDKDGLIQGVNKAWLKMYKYSSVKEIVGQHFTAIQKEDDIEKADRVVKGILNRQTGYLTGEFSRKCRDNSIGYHTFSARPAIREGKTVGIEGFIIDTTERKIAENNLKSSLKEKEILIKELHHRVKNNMQVIISLMKLQSNQFTDDKLKIAFQESESRIYAMAAVHETLHQSERLTSIDLAQYLSKLSNTTIQTYRIGSVYIKIITDIKPIKLKLEQSYPIGLVFNELLSNSTKYAFPEGKSGEIKILGEMITPEKVKLIIADNGVGLPHGYDWRNTESLGLQIVRALIEDQLGGTIHLDCSSGACWEIVFPI